MHNAIRKCELKMILGVLEALKDGCEMSYVGVICCGINKTGRFQSADIYSEIHNLRREFGQNRHRLTTIKRGPWLPGAIEKVERELEGLK